MKYYITYYNQRINYQGHVKWFPEYSMPQYIRPTVKKEYYSLNNARWILSKLQKLQPVFHYYSHQIHVK